MDTTQVSTYPNHKERRQSFRYATNIGSVLESEEHSIYTTVINLSKEGVGFLSAKPSQTDDIVNIHFDYHDNLNNPITLKVHVLSCREVDLEYYIGGSIINQTDEFQKFYASIPHVY